MLGLWGVLGILGVPFCVAFAHVMVVGNLARVLSVLEGESYGFESLLKAKSLMEGKRQTALVMALSSNMGLRLVERLFEFRMCSGISLWEAPLLVSIYPLLEQRADASFSKTLAAGPDATISSEISTAQTSEQLKSITTNTSDCKMPSYL
ncbi:hypothetical protein CFP56_003225 [Quercus suber]|uniref:Uncharacterized protein n=1 Tax=Quercus suber TaxID=58331 RepID=A0AAW0LEL8_QUESU